MQFVCVPVFVVRPWKVHGRPFMEQFIVSVLFLRRTRQLGKAYPTLLLARRPYAEIVTRMGRSVTSRSECAPYFVQAFRMLVRVIGIPINQELLRKELVCRVLSVCSIHFHSTILVGVSFFSL